ncbi:transcription initiation factor tfiid subunit related [Cyclospora cayetanensis]|uniref:Transcription initiation factor tfiid subunit related n=1 Tax=Cyclospora cayetanensis TaxID=88456 RepID=A0A1D3D0D9_9EIME|nr:transcription initiation factor tfiid subunit related [Cyclospora cayetanensis]
MDEDGSPSKAKSNLGSSKCCYKLIGHEGRVLALTFAEAGDRCLLTGGSDAVIRLHYFASGSGDNLARLWCTSRSSPLRLLQHPGAATDVPHVYMHPNSSLLLTAASDGVVRVFDLRAADAVRTWELPTAAGPLPSHLEGDRGSGAAAARAASAAVGAEISQVDGTLRWPLDPRLLSAAGRTALSSKSYHTSSLNGEASALTASPNGRLAAAAETHATALSFCYNSSLLAGTTGDGRVLLWDTAAASRGGEGRRLQEVPDSPGLGSQGTAPSLGEVDELKLLQCLYGRALAFRVCTFTPENLLMVGGLSTLDLTDV